MDRVFVIIGSLVMFVAVAFGAFGAHALDDYFLDNPDLKSSFDTAVRYQVIHGLALFLVAWVFQQWQVSSASAAGWLFVAGILLFSGSLYILSLFGVRWLGAITPLGGICFLIGWILIAITAWKN